jgi:hypothetical protein
MDKEHTCPKCQGFKRAPVSFEDYPGGPQHWVQGRCPECAGTGMTKEAQAAFETTKPAPPVLKGDMDYRAYVDKLRDERLHE